MSLLRRCPRFRSLTARLLAALQVMLLCAPLGIALPAEAAGPGGKQIVICTVEGLKLLNLADGSGQDVPRHDAKARHCPLCVLTGDPALLPHGAEAAEPLAMAAAIMRSRSPAPLRPAAVHTHRSRAPPAFFAV